MTPPALIKVGGAEIRRVLEMAIRSPMAGLTQNQKLLDTHEAWIKPHFLGEDGRWDLQFQTWVMQVDGKTFVIDPCTGNGRSNIVPIFNGLDTPFIERFSATGVKPEAVDYVFCTHMHHDHCGWNTQLRDGRYVPTFPNARYLFVRREYERWDPALPGHKPVNFNIGVFEQSIRPVIDAGLALLVEDHHRILPSVGIEPAYGHTLGHSILHVNSQAEEAFFTGDVFHHPIQIVDPNIHFHGCDDLEQAIATRRRLIAHCAERNALIIPAHFPAPHAGWIRHKDGNAVFEELRNTA